MISLIFERNPYDNQMMKKYREFSVKAFYFAAEALEFAKIV